MRLAAGRRPSDGLQRPASSMAVSNSCAGVNMAAESVGAAGVGYRKALAEHHRDTRNQQ